MHDVFLMRVLLMQVAGRSLNSDSADDKGRVLALDPVRLAKLRAANEIVRASWQYRVSYASMLAAVGTQQTLRLSVFECWRAARPSANTSVHCLGRHHTLYRPHETKTIPCHLLMGPF